jgi:HD-like signal output (HDOD) protein
MSDAMNTQAASFDLTFETLMAKARQKGDIPAFSDSARSILNALAADADNDFDLIQAVLADMTLTQRTLRLANSAMYAAFGGEVNSVSRAVQVLGVQTIAHLALGLKVLDSVDRSRPETAAALAEMHKAVLASFLGRQLAGSQSSLKDAETASVCSILLGLGRLLVAFYMPETFARIESEAAAFTDAAQQEAVARAALGGSFAEIGQRMARHWNLPPALTATLRTRVPLPGQMPDSHEEWLSTVATAATQSAEVLHGKPADLELAFADIVQAYAPSLGLEPGAMLNVIRAANKAAQQHFAGEPPPLVRPVTEAEKVARLQRSFEELQETAQHANLTQSLILSLEYLHQNFGAWRSFAFLLMPKDRQYSARFGLGEKATAMLPKLHFDSQTQADLFHAVLAKERALFIEDTQAAALKGKLPAWWSSQLGSARSFCLIPLRVRQSPLAFLYMDWAPPVHAPAMNGARMEMVTKVRQSLLTNLERSVGKAPG